MKRILYFILFSTLISSAAFAQKRINNQQKKLPYSLRSIEAIAQFGKTFQEQDRMNELKCNLNLAMSIVSLSDYLIVDKDNGVLHFVDNEYMGGIKREVVLHANQDGSLNNVTLIENTKVLEGGLFNSTYQDEKIKTECL